MANFITTAVLLILGIILRRLRIFPENTATSLNLFVIYISLPALVLLQIPTLEFSTDIITPIIMPWAMLILSAGAIMGLSKILHWQREITGALLLIVPLGNTSFLGIPMVEVFLGSDKIPYAVLYDQLGSFMALATYGALILSIYGNNEKLSAASIIKKICSFPPFLALILALTLKNTVYPQEVTKMLQIIAASLVPVVMIAVGFQLKLRMDPQNWSPFSIGLGIKLIIAPLIALIACQILGLKNEAALVAVFEAGMPPMITAGALATIAGLAPELAGAMVGYGIVFSFFTLPALFTLLNG